MKPQSKLQASKVVSPTSLSKDNRQELLSQIVSRMNSESQSQQEQLQSITDNQPVIETHSLSQLYIEMKQLKLQFSSRDSDITQRLHTIQDQMYKLNVHQSDSMVQYFKILNSEVESVQDKVQQLDLTLNQAITTTKQQHQLETAAFDQKYEELKAQINQLESKYSQRTTTDMQSKELIVKTQSPRVLSSDLQDRVTNLEILFKQFQESQRTQQMQSALQQKTSAKPESANDTGSNTSELLSQLQDTLQEQKRMWTVLNSYFDDQIEEMIMFVQTNPTIIEQGADHSLNQFMRKQSMHQDSTVLRQKIDCLGWLVRNHEFIKPDRQDALLKAFWDVELPKNDQAQRRKFATSTPGSQAIISVSSQLMAVTKKELDQNKCILILRVLEILTRNEEAVNIGVLQSKLQRSLNDLVLLLGYQTYRKGELTTVKLLMRVMCNTMKHNEAKRQFLIETTKLLIALVNIMLESKDKETVANGLVCINLAFTQETIISKTISEFTDFSSRVSEIASVYGQEEHIQNEVQQILKRLERVQKQQSLGELYLPATLKSRSSRAEYEDIDIGEDSLSNASSYTKISTKLSNQGLVNRYGYESETIGQPRVISVQNFKLATSDFVSGVRNYTSSNQPMHISQFKVQRGNQNAHRNYLVQPNQ